MRNARRKRKYKEEMHADQQRTISVRAETKQEQLVEKRVSKEQKMRPNISGKCRTGNVLKQLVGGVGGWNTFCTVDQKEQQKMCAEDVHQLCRLISNFFFIFIDELITALMSKNDFI